MYYKLQRVFFIFLSIFLLMACTSGSGKSINEDYPQLKIGVMSSMDYLPLAVAKENEFFKKEGVDVVINKFYSANERDAAFQSGNLDGTIIDYTGAAIQRAGGIEIKIASQCDGSFVLVAAKEDAINTLSDLRGKRLAVSRNTVIDFCTDWILQGADIELSEVEKVEINKIPLRLEMLRNNKIDATMLPDPFITIALDDGNKEVVDIQDMDLRVTGIAFHDKVIIDKQSTIQGFYRAYNQAVHLLNSQPVSSFDNLLITEIGFPPNLVSKVELPKYSKAQLPQTQDLQKVEQWLKDSKLVADDFNIDTLVATDLIP